MKGQMHIGDNGCQIKEKDWGSDWAGEGAQEILRRPSCHTLFIQGNFFLLLTCIFLISLTALYLYWLPCFIILLRHCKWKSWRERKWIYRGFWWWWFHRRFRGKKCIVETVLLSTARSTSPPSSSLSININSDVIVVIMILISFQEMRFLRSPETALLFSGFKISLAATVGLNDVSAQLL